MHKCSIFAIFGGNIDMTTFERIKDSADKQGLSLRNVASKAGLGETTIYGWKKRTPDSKKLQAVADSLNISIDYLLGNEDNTEHTSDEETLTKNQKLVAYSIDPDISDEERNAIINMVHEAMKFRHRI